MKLGMIFAAAAAATIAFATPAAAQNVPRSLVAIYHVAPGQQVGFLKWLAHQDEMAASAGVPKSQLYVHTDGDSWDYVVISPQTTQAQDDAVDAVAKKMGMNPRHGGLDLRKYITSHTDTMTLGPTSAAEYLAWVGEK
jgi:membrane-bound lytic murein transglycosylase B